MRRRIGTTSATRAGQWVTLPCVPVRCGRVASWNVEGISLERPRKDTLPGIIYFWTNEHNYDVRRDSFTDLL
eukprot:1572318-Pyramimonas_sp.AAC.1